MHQTARPPAAISELSHPLPRWRYWILFHSWGQFQSWVFIVVLASALLAWGIGQLRGEALPPFVLLGGAAGGSLVSVVLARRVRFTVMSGGRASLHLASTLLEGMRYVVAEQTPDRIVYRQNVHRLLRWDEGNVVLSADQDRVMIEGPYALLKHLHKLLRRQLQGAVA